ncbi:hypothetical protein BC936DRAFT_149630 [Jimgerdemannia flammicorona]|uniref:DH domain-containing protein n=1 Tax=Jimgerdemannia flammicorona TaxID=994334 RepID=A0A433D0I0_9FUNG|nr:hypothetical protein BC936DRAFT_149630 [Jimgerdemannia flammicorona]
MEPYTTEQTGPLLEGQPTSDPLPWPLPEAHGSASVFVMPVTDLAKPILSIDTSKARHLPPGPISSPSGRSSPALFPRNPSVLAFGGDQSANVDWTRQTLTALFDHQRDIHASREPPQPSPTHSSGTCSTPVSGSGLSRSSTTSTVFTDDASSTTSFSSVGTRPLRGTEIDRSCSPAYATVYSSSPRTLSAPPSINRFDLGRGGDENATIDVHEILTHLAQVPTNVVASDTTDAERRTTDASLRDVAIFPDLSAVLSLQNLVDAEGSVLELVPQIDENSSWTLDYKRSMKRSHALLELMETERIYVRHLRTLVKNFFDRISGAEWIPEEHRKMLVRNANEILEFQESFLIDLEAAYGGGDDISVRRMSLANSWEKSRAVANCFVNSSKTIDFPRARMKLGPKATTWDLFVLNLYIRISCLHALYIFIPCFSLQPQRSKFDLYNEYCLGQKAAVALTNEYEGRTNWLTLMKDCSQRCQAETGQTNRLEFKDYLIKPVQRICQYHLLLKELLKPTPDDFPDHAELSSAVRVMEAAVAQIDGDTGRKDNAERTGRFLARLDESWSLAMPFLQQLGVIVLSGALQVIYHAADPRKVKYLGCFVFTEPFMMIVNPKKADEYEPKHWFPLRFFELKELADGQGAFHYLYGVRKLTNGGGPNQSSGELPNAWWLVFNGHVFEFGATCLQEKKLWIKVIGDTIERAKAAFTEDHPDGFCGGDTTGDLFASSLVDLPPSSSIRTSRSYPNLFQLASRMSFLPRTSFSISSVDGSNSGRVSPSGTPGNLTNRNRKASSRSLPHQSLNDFDPASAAYKRRSNSLDLKELWRFGAAGGAKEKVTQVKNNQTASQRNSVDLKFSDVSTQDYLSSRALHRARSRHTSGGFPTLGGNGGTGIGAGSSRVPQLKKRHSTGDRIPVVINTSSVLPFSIAEEEKLGLSAITLGAVEEILDDGLECGKGRMSNEKLSGKAKAGVGAGDWGSVDGDVQQHTASRIFHDQSRGVGTAQEFHKYGQEFAAESFARQWKRPTSFWGESIRNSDFTKRTSFYFTSATSPPQDTLINPFASMTSLPSTEQEHISITKSTTMPLLSNTDQNHHKNLLKAVFGKISTIGKGRRGGNRCETSGNSVEEVENWRADTITPQSRPLSSEGAPYTFRSTTVTTPSPLRLFAPLTASHTPTASPSPPNSERAHSLSESYSSSQEQQEQSSTVQKFSTSPGSSSTFSSSHSQSTSCLSSAEQPRSRPQSQTDFDISIPSECGARDKDKKHPFFHPYKPTMTQDKRTPNGMSPSQKLRCSALLLMGRRNSSLPTDIGEELDFDEHDSGEGDCCRHHPEGSASCSRDGSYSPMELTPTLLRRRPLSMDAILMREDDGAGFVIKQNVTGTEAETLTGVVESTARLSVVELETTMRSIEEVRMQTLAKLEGGTAHVDAGSVVTVASVFDNIREARRSMSEEGENGRETGVVRALMIIEE